MITSGRLTSHVSRPESQSGMALVLTLMIVTLITAMVVEFAYGVYVNTSALHNWQTSQELSLTAKSATRLASKLISAPGGAQNPLMRNLYITDKWEMSQKIPFGDLDGTVTLTIEDVNAKFNLNALKNPIGTDNNDAYSVFVKLLESLNLNSDIANMVCYWINSSTAHRPQNSGNIQPKNTYLDSTDELLAIPGIDEKSYSILERYVTIYGSANGMFSINLNTADVPVLMSLSESITRDMAENIRSFRPLNSILVVPGFKIDTLPAGHVVYAGSAYRVVATAESGGIKRVIESVLQGGTVLYWKEI